MNYDATAQFYDAHPAQALRGDVDFFVGYAARAGRCLEVGCGTGRVLLPCARAGASVVGLDASELMLAVAQGKLGQEAPEVQARVALHQGDMRAFNLGATFPLVTLPFRPFQHLLTVEDQLACLGCVRRHLEPGGLLILDLYNPSLELLTEPERWREVQDGPLFTLPDGSEAARFVRILSHDPLLQVQEVEMRYEIQRSGGGAESHFHRFSMRHLYRYEAEHLLVRAGFTVEKVLADYSGTPYGTLYPGELVFLARHELTPGGPQGAGRPG